VDEAVLERSSRVGSLRATFQWDDVGSWEALSRTITADERGNHTVGDIHSLDSKGNIAFAEGGSIVLFGVEGLVVVRCGDAVLVAERSRTPDLKKLIRTLPDELRDPERP
jgi:mannose-1-phosphate guanylyltransferase